MKVHRNSRRLIPDDDKLFLVQKKLIGKLSIQETTTRGCCFVPATDREKASVPWPQLPIATRKKNETGLSTKRQARGQNPWTRSIADKYN